MERLLRRASEVARGYDSISTTTTLKEEQTFTLFGYSVKLKKERTNNSERNDGTTNFFFELIEIDDAAISSSSSSSSSSSAMLFKKPTKTLDFIALMEQHSTKLQKISNIDDETYGSLIDLQLGIGCPASATNNKKRSWISINSSNDHNNKSNDQILCSWPAHIKKRRLMIPRRRAPPNNNNNQILCCWPPLKKKQRSMMLRRGLAPNRNSATLLDLAIGLPVVNEETNVVQVQLPSDQWKVRKALKKSDVDSSSRLLIGLDMVYKHILPHIVRPYIINNAEFDDTLGTEVVVWDVDTGSEHTLTFKRWKSKSFVFVGGWKSDFVNRRNLKENDIIGLEWDSVNSRFQFTLLGRN